MFRLALLAACLLFLWLLARDVWAQQLRWCDDRDSIVSALEGRYGESVVGAGVIPAKPGRPSGLMSVYANRESGTWTITITAANDNAPSGFASCVAASGQGFRLSPPAQDPDT